MQKLIQSWDEFLGKDLLEISFSKFLEKIEAYYHQDSPKIFPPKNQLFEALNSTTPKNVKVVILGQDPYPTFGHANGLAFSVNAAIKPFPKSLQNIFKELTIEDPTFQPKNNGDLKHWADQGVLLLNTVLTVEEGRPESHFNIGWEVFTDLIIQKLGVQENVIFVLFGNKAQKKEYLLDASKVKIFKLPHPSPLSAYRGFFDSKIFTKINEELLKLNKSIIYW